MSIIILYTDLRQQPSVLQRIVVDYEQGLTARDVVRRALGNERADQIDAELAANNADLLISWYDPNTHEVPEIGGVGTLDWPIKDSILLTINWQNDTTTPQQIEDADNWVLENESLP